MTSNTDLIRRIAAPILATVLAIAVGAANAAPLKQMPIDFVGEWCNGETFEGQTNWKLPSWLDEDERKCTNILSVTKYDFSMEIDKKSFYCLPVAIRLKEDTAPSGTAYLATISAHCTTGQETGRGKPATFEFQRYKGNIYIKQK
ncbi:hypothetical protein [Bradyrhizobium sp.]|uniref:hypothetical protein n=1 Tax=Bradyrhizobium sp. TaxID=376 RepID=UPI002719C516|nr:hypothetical protein [Bradyrhizobium sp.]MDO9297328.1 hypothetical protein [Bradyrhizobium sp.]